jgi:hypothetical protein
MNISNAQYTSLRANVQTKAKVLLCKTSPGLRQARLHNINAVGCFGANIGNSIDANPQLIARRFTSTFAKESLPKGGPLRICASPKWKNGQVCLSITEIANVFWSSDDGVEI